MSRMPLRFKLTLAFTGVMAVLLAIAGIGMRRVMGFTVISFFVSSVVFGASLLLLVP